MKWYEIIIISKVVALKLFVLGPRILFKVLTKSGTSFDHFPCMIMKEIRPRGFCVQKALLSVLTSSTAHLIQTLNKNV
jgi:hypothetical protein